MDGNDERLILRALELARMPPYTLPNPRVGAVFARAGEIVGEGAHEGPGSPHAETVARRGVDVSGTTLYVNLEPCVHQGRTPACAPALIEAGISRAVIAITDPDPRVAGRGVELLVDNGVEVRVGVAEAEARSLNRSYLHHRTTGLPFVTLKLALTLDGHTTAPDGSSRWITGPGARRRAHARRLECGAVLVGAETALIDDPALTVRDVPAGRQPLRIVVDSSGRLPPEARLLSAEAPTIVATTSRAPHEIQLAWKEAGAETFVLPADESGRVDLRALLAALGERGVAEVYCEGGAVLAGALLQLDLIDSLEVHRGAVLTGGGASLADLGVGSLDRAPRWRLLSSESIGDDIISTYERAR